MKRKLLSILLCLAMALSLLPTAALAEGEGATAAKGTSENPYSREEFEKMTREQYIEAQNALDGTMYVTVGKYSYDKNGVLGNGVRNDTPGQTPDHSKLNAYGENGYLGEKNDGANGKNIVFVGGTITSGATGYASIDNIGTSLLLAVPAYTNVTFKGTEFNNVMSFNYQLYTSPWSQLGELKFDGCKFNGIIVGGLAAQTLTFNGCTFTNYTNTTSANSSNPTWIRPAYGNWRQGDNEGQGSDFRSLTEINFTGNTVTSTRPVKFEFISQWDITSTVTATGNTFDIKAQDDDNEIKNVGLYLGAHTDENEFHLVADKNTKSDNTAALYTIPEGKTSLPAGSTVKDSKGNEIELTDALKWKGNPDDGLTLKTECEAKIGDAYYATLAEAFAAVPKTGDTVIELLDNIDMTGKSWTPVKVDGYNGAGVVTLNGNNHKITGLRAPLFAGGFAGNSGIVIKDLTIDRANINDTTNTQGIGAFINCVDSMPRIELFNCHLTNSTIESTGGARVGGLIGWTAGYNNPNDGPVDTYISIRDCSVELCNITAKGSVGGLIGHAGGNPATYHDIADCKLVNNYLYSTDDGGWRVGALVGTANVGQVTVDAATSAIGNTLSQTGKTSAALANDLFGRAVVNDDGLVIVDNKVVAAAEKYGVAVGDKVTSDNLVKNENGVWEKAPDPYIDLDTFIKWVQDNDYSVDGSSYTANKRAVQNGKLTVKWSPVSGCFKDNSNSYLGTCKISNSNTHTPATGNTPTYINSNLAQYFEFEGQANVTIKNVNFVYVADDFTICANNNGISKNWTKDKIKTAQLYLRNSGNTTIEGCSFDHVVFTSFQNIGKTVIKDSSFKNIYDSYAIKDLGGSSVEVSDCTFENCGGGIMLDSNNNERKDVTPATVTISGNTFTRVDVDGTASTTPENKVGTRGLLQIPSKGDYTGTAITLDGNTATNCGPTLRQLNQGIADNDVLSKNLKGDLTGLGGELTFTDDSVKKTSGEEPSQPTIYTVKFSGSDVADMKVASGTEITLPTATKYGYTFKGWKLGTETKNANDKVTISSDTTFTAVWQSNSSSSGSSGSSTSAITTPSKTENGTVTVSPRYASKGDTVTVTVKPDSGYVLETLTVTDKNGNELTLKDKGNGKYTFTMPAGKVEVKATFMEDNSMLNFFYDVPNNAYFYEAVKWAVENGITTGVGNDLFAPEQPCTRAQIVTFLWRAAGSPEPKGAASGMTDVVSGSYYEKAVAWAIENGITTGTTASTFSPDATCTRAQAVTFLARALSAKASGKAEFSDVPADSYFADAVAWAAANGVTEGIGGGLFGSDNDCTRGQIVTFLYRAYNK